MHTFDGKDLQKLGKALFGEHWTGSMSRRLGVTQSYLRLLAKGQRAIPPGMLVDLEELCAERMRLIERVHAPLMDFRFRKAA